MDYKELLTKYIQYVFEVEGVNFIDYGYEWTAATKFTEEEWKELEILAETEKFLNGK